MAVFAKAPVPGRVKTRLAGVLGNEGAARLHAQLVRYALETAAAAAPGRVELWADPADDAFLRDSAHAVGASVHAQHGDDLGARMRHAFEHAHATGARLVLIGCDCPALTPAHLHAAIAALDGADAAIAPAEDGGYVLVALRKPCPFLFEAMPWSTADVMRETRRRLDLHGVAWRELPTLWDVDRADDYTRLCAAALLEGLEA